MPLIQNLEDRAASWAFRKFLAHAIVNYKTTLAGIVTLLGALTMLINQVVDAAQTGQLHLESIAHTLAAITAAIGLIAARDGDVSSQANALDANGNPIPKAEVVN